MLLRTETVEIAEIQSRFHYSSFLMFANILDHLILPSSEPAEGLLASCRGGKTQKENFTPLKPHFSLWILSGIVHHH